MIFLVLFSIFLFNFRVHASSPGDFGGRELSLITSLNRQSHFLTQRDARFSFALQSLKISAMHTDGVARQLLRSIIWVPVLRCNPVRMF
ncbi:hypothetical protein K438DRAFT_1820237 [Mycena galopus ATCC 62051]|nr:hypothetical protein K438DRAFT_1820237 [Mycena galopus ATCC 62051]